MTSIAELFALGVQHHQAGNIAYAEQIYRQVIEADPGHVDAYSKLGNVFFLQGRFDTAVNCYQRVLLLKPDNAQACYNLGLAQQRQGKGEDAVASYRQAVKIQPGLCVAWNNLGIALKSIGKLDEAIECYRHVLRLKPDYGEVHANLGNALAEQKHLAEALKSYRQALRWRPNDPDTFYNMGIALGLEGQFEEARAALQRAVQLQPNHVESYYNLGILYQERGKMDEALTCYDQALQRDPGHGASHLNRALIWLLRGDWQRGWAEYEWRWTQPGFQRHPCPQPQWNGSSLAGKTILLYAEQGLGDTLNFVRYVPVVKKLAGKVILESQPALMQLMAKIPGVDQLIVRGTDLPPFHVHAPLLSLPGVFRTTPDKVLADVPYLHAEPALVEHWRKELSQLEGEGEGGRRRRIGIAWQGNPTHPLNHYRSIPLVKFARVAAIPGVQLISLQKGPGNAQLHELNGQFSVLDLESRLGDESQSFMNLAAVMKNLDLVISCDTAIAHLAGGLGVPVWVALPLVPDWRWLLQREDSPWYPTMRLFRQTKQNDWDDVFDRMVQAVGPVCRTGTGRSRSRLPDGTRSAVRSRPAGGTYLEPTPFAGWDSERGQVPPGRRDLLGANPVCRMGLGARSGPARQAGPTWSQRRNAHSR